MSIMDLENARRERQQELNAAQANRESLERQYGRVWSTDEVRKEFEVIAFAAPYMIVERLSDRKRGSLEFQHSPRFYFNWQEA